MVKTRMNIADVAAEVKCLRKLIGMRCANVYDLSPKIYIFKLMKSSGATESGESEKVLLLLESGVRLHTTQFSRDKSMTPSGFTLKLRKHIRTKRLEDVRQLGIDRVVDFQFGMGNSAHHIILELYDQGNILLTDADYNVLTLLRTHRDDETGLTMMPRHRYPVELCRTWQKTSFEKLRLQLLNQGISKPIASYMDGNEQKVDVEMTEGKRNLNTSRGDGKSEKRNLKSILSEYLGYGPTLSEHILLDAGLQPNMKIEIIEGKSMPSLTEGKIKALFDAIEQLENWIQEIVFGERIPEGYIIFDRAVSGRSQVLVTDDGQTKVYCDFSPLWLKQFGSWEFLRLETFDAALDNYFSKIEGQRVEQQRKVQEGSIIQKLDKIRKDQEKRVESLKKEVEYSVHMAELIEYNLDDVDAAILAVRVALASGKDWKELARMVKEEKKAGNPVAGLIHSLQFEKNQITLLLSNNLDEMDDEEKTQPVDKVEVDLALSAHANACRWYEMKKKQASKQEKTVSAHEKAFKAAEKRVHQQLAQAKSIASISHIRKVHWFEKFNWFISSENYLIISGRDAQQNELVVKRHLRKGDLYVHADLHGASSTVIKNHHPEDPIPPLTLNQAGCYTVCRSQAWDSKIVTSAWWVHAHQVSKSAPTGEYLTVGSFMIRGKKNFLPPHPLVMGFGILFRVEESCIAAHWNERKLRVEDADNDTMPKHPQTETFAEKIKEESEGIATMQVGFHAIHIDSNQGINGLLVSAENSEVDDVVDCLDNTDPNVSSENDSVGGVRNEPHNFTAFDELIDKALELTSQLNPRKCDNHLKDPYAEETVKDKDDECTNDIMSGSIVQRERPYLSKAERRKLKKGSSYMPGNPNQDPHEFQVQLEAKEGRGKVLSSEREDQTKEKSIAGKIARGQRSKLKKKKEKYAEQDEEDRNLRLLLLGSTGKVQQHNQSGATVDGMTGSRVKSSAEGPSVSQDLGKQDSKCDSVKVCYSCKKAGHVARDCESVPNLINRQEGSVDSDHENTESKDAEIEKAAVIAEENILELGDEEREKLTELDSLTGCPFPDDILLYALPVCGPYSALQNYKYRVKLIPGTLKKGKAARTAVNLFIHLQDAKTREKELIKAVTEPELVASIISNTKITAPGLTNLKQQQKKIKKASTSLE